MSHTAETVSPPSELLTLIEIKNVREGGMIDAMIPVELIDRSEVPVESGHVEELARSMIQEMENGTVSGIMTPILLAEIPGRNKFSIIDGFHRDAASRSIGSPTIYGSIRPNTTENEVLDLRIMTAKSHKDVSFARTHEWVSDAWTRTPWYEQGITATQAFGFASNKSTNGRNLGIEASEFEEIRSWARDKCDKWGVSVQAIYTTLVTASLSDPELVKSARRRKGGNELTELTPQHLGVIARALPHRFEDQKLIAQIVKDKQLTVDNTKRVLEMVKDIDLTEDIAATLIQTDWDSILVQPKKGRPPRSSAGYPAPTESESAGSLSEKRLRRQLLVSEVKLARLTFATVVLEGQYVATPLTESRESAFHITPKSTDELQRFISPSTDQDTTEAFLTLFDTAQTTLVMQLAKHTGIEESVAAKLIDDAAKRVCRDIEDGALQYARISHPKTLLEIVKKTALTELRNPTVAPEASPEPTETPTYSVEAAELALPTLAYETRHALALVGFMNFNTHSTGQAIQLKNSTLRDAISVAKQRLHTVDSELARYAS